MQLDNREIKEEEGENKDMKVGIRGHDLGRGTPEAFANSIKEAGFESIQLVLNKAIEFDTKESPILCDEFTDNVKKHLLEQNINVAMLGAYFNPVHSDKEKVAISVDNFKDHLRKAKFFGTQLVGTETGSYNDDQWVWHQNNSSEKAFQEVCHVFKEILPTAKEEGVYLAIEPAYHHVISTPKRLKKLITELNSAHVCVIFDLFNLLCEENHENQRELIDEMTTYFSNQILIVHAKDFVIYDGKIKQVAPGRGNLDYPYLLEKLRELKTDPVIIFEGVTGEDIALSKVFLTDLLKS